MAFKRSSVQFRTFRISFIAPREKTEKEQPLPAREFALYRAGLYDMKEVLAMAWDGLPPVLC